MVDFMIMINAIIHKKYKNIYRCVMFYLNDGIICTKILDREWIYDLNFQKKFVWN